MLPALGAVPVLGPLHVPPVLHPDVLGPDLPSVELLDGIPGFLDGLVVDVGEGEPILLLLQGHPGHWSALLEQLLQFCLLDLRPAWGTSSGRKVT